MKFGIRKNWGGSLLHTLIVVLILLAQFHQCAAGHDHASGEPCAPCPTGSHETLGLDSIDNDQHNHCELKSCSNHEVFELKAIPSVTWEFVLPSSSVPLVFAPSNVRTKQSFIWIVGHFPNGPPRQFPARAPPAGLA